MTKKQLIALFEAMETTSHNCARSAEETGSTRLYHFERGHASALATVISVLKNPKFAKELAEIYEVAL